MAKETLDPNPREIKFGGEGKSDDINRGFAITTIRNPKSAYNFSRGEVVLADCFDDNKKVPIVVITNEIKELGRFSVPQLALDGFFSAPDVIDGMKTYPGYEELNKKSVIQAITFVKKESFDALSPEPKTEILGHYSDFDELVKMPQLKHLFFPTMCLHITKQGGSLNNWSYFLKSHDLISPLEYKQMKMVADTNDTLNDPDILHTFSLWPKQRYFKPLVLGLFK